MMRSILMLVAAVAVALHAEPVAADDERFHKLNAAADGNTQNPVCRECHVADAADSHSWLTPRKDAAIEIQNLEETPEEPDAFSLACLSCHDGSLAGTVLNAPVSPCGIKPKSGIVDRNSNHPVFMRYSQGKPDLHDPDRALQGDWNGAKRVEELLREEKVVCISCHVPHHSSRSGYLRVNQNGSALCFGCHRK